MSEAIEITVSSNLSSANASSAISNHSGKANRMRFEHANPEIDKELTYMNVEFDLHDRDELLNKHYGAMIEKHNKNNNSAARRWDLKTYLETFEGKTVKIGGKETKNKRWSTATQISYFGGKDSLLPVLEEIMDAGALPEEVCAAYAQGYGEYVQSHNEKFPTLPIYHSDVHFDETTPHGHDAIVVMGHTEKGKPSDSINNALGELYGYPKDFAGKKANMVRYREENDEILFMSIAPKLEALGKAYGVDVEFEPIRIGETGSLDYETYKVRRDLDEREAELEETEAMLSSRSKATAKITEAQRIKNAELKSRENDLAARESDLMAREGDVIARERGLREKERQVVEMENKLAAERDKLQQIEKLQQQREKEQRDRHEKIKQREQNVKQFVKEHTQVATAVASAVLLGDPDEQRAKLWKAINRDGLGVISPEGLKTQLVGSIEESNNGLRRRKMGGSEIVERNLAKQRQNEGPEL